MKLISVLTITFYAQDGATPAGDASSANQNLDKLLHPCKCSARPEMQYIQSANPQTPSQLCTCSPHTSMVMWASQSDILYFSFPCSLFPIL